MKTSTAFQVQVGRFIGTCWRVGWLLRCQGCLVGGTVTRVHIDTAFKDCAIFQRYPWRHDVAAHVPGFGYNDIFVARDIAGDFTVDPDGFGAYVSGYLA